MNLPACPLLPFFLSLFFSTSLWAGEILLVAEEADLEDRTEAVGEIKAVHLTAGIVAKPAQHDAIVLASTDTPLDKAFERSLQKYVSQGGHLLVVHGAGDCFQKEDIYRGLVGGVFASFSSKKAEVRATQCEEAHPLFKGVGDITVPEPKYQHGELSETCRVVLRRDGLPYVWERTFGKGMVIYIGYGGNDETWKEVSFRKLLANALARRDRGELE